ncbi:hypothetical protein [Alkalihalobacillus pseudalcaliphilus]|uniref:hypothetical protein n=1 Tax=Alkalihalobacillus pseudalcaliphilus TaxID=79884 RepID=UPI00064D96DF|nr:hypothetical protein [Alkalihalobacillus pseudalcaliphilus]KMK75442.1 hypothetical protein AB990_09010 [Alkalihalobacillus pseudalcaliphilus]
MNENGKLYKFLEKVAENKAGYVLLLCIYKLQCAFTFIKNYFKRDAFIEVQYCYYGQVGDQKKTKFPDSFNIYVIEKGNCTSLFNKIDFSEAERIAKLLTEDKDKLKLEIGLGMGTSYIIIPKWAKKRLSDELFEVVENTREMVQDYKKWAEGAE